jgi:hypothetical protein
VIDAAAKSGEGRPPRIIQHVSRRLDRNIPGPKPRRQTPKFEPARLRYLLGRLRALGPAPLVHFLREVAAGADNYITLETYASLPADFIRTYGGDKFASPLHAVDGGAA